MASLTLIQLFIIGFFFIFVVILLYFACRRIWEIVVTPDAELKERIRSRTTSSSSSNSGNSGVGGSSVSGRRNSQNSNNSVITINNLPGVHRAQTIYVRAGNQVGGPSGPSSSVYTIPVGSLDLRRTSVVIIQQPNNSANLSIPQAVIEEPPPSYEECVSRVSSDPAEIV